jgi:hypothetical protein
MARRPFLLGLMQEKLSADICMDRTFSTVSPAL